ncbi:MAG: MFS transporter [Planctomycetota bacterium]
MARRREEGTPSPWRFVPILYFLQGLPLFVVQELATNFFTKMGVALGDIGGWMSLLRTPWTIKALWSPLVEVRSTKRAWIRVCQAAIFAGLCATALGAASTSFLPWTLGALVFVAFASATFDIAADGFYILALDERRQAAFVGVRSVFYRVAGWFTLSALMLVAGALERTHSQSVTWRAVFFAAAAAYGAGALVSAIVLPRPPRDVLGNAATWPPFVPILRAYFRRERIGAILAFILLYRLPESMISVYSGPFLLSPENGGLGLSSEQVGWIKGTVGLGALIAGGLLGGALIARNGIRRSFWPMVIAMNVPNVLYVWAAAARPGPWPIGGLVAIDQFGYGFGFAAYMVYLMYLTQGERYPAAHYAISTALMSAAVQVANWISGEIVRSVDFERFFQIVCLCSVPGMLTLLFIPMDRDDLKVAPTEPA